MGQAPLSLNFLCLFFAAGLTLPYLPVFFRNMGFSHAEVGLLSSLQTLTTCIFPPLAGYLVSRLRFSVKTSLLLATILAIFLSAGLFWPKTFWPLAFFCFSLFAIRSLMNPFLDTITMGWVREKNYNYGSIRLFGSIGFLLASCSGSYLFLRHPTEDFLLAHLVCAAILLPCVFSLKDPPFHGMTASKAPPFRMNQTQLVFLSATFLINLAHAPYFAYYSIYLQEKILVPVQHTGMFWAFAVFCEILLFSSYRRIMGHWSLSQVLHFSLWMALIRFFLMGFFESAALLFLLQGLHAFTFGSYHLASVSLIPKIFPPDYQTLGFSLYMCSAFGISGFVGMIGSSFLFDSLGFQWIFGLSSIFPLLAICLLILYPLEHGSTSARG